MDASRFIAAYNDSRNGCSTFVRHPMVRKFLYSDGVQECVEAGCYWLIDVLATELPAEFKKNADRAFSCVVLVEVKDSKAVIIAEFVDGEVGWSKVVNYTDMPEGKWQFYIADEGDAYRMILLTEY